MDKICLKLFFEIFFVGDICGVLVLELCIVDILWWDLFWMVFIRGGGGCVVWSGVLCVWGVVWNVVGNIDVVDLFFSVGSNCFFLRWGFLGKVELL